MKQYELFSDDRLQGYCVHCGEIIQDEANREHSPTRSFLNEPYPEGLPTVPVHRACNNSYSLDEEYFGAFLASVICGSTEPDPVQFPAAARALRHGPPLRTRIEQAQTIRENQSGDLEILWTAEMERVNRVIVKNARCHVFYELGEIMPSEPSGVGILPLSYLSDIQRRDFENTPNGYLWPEVGSRMMQRMANGELQQGGWVEVQSNVYRYAVCQTHEGVLARMVLREYLAAEVSWD